MRNSSVEINNCIYGRVIKIVDGDTFDILKDDQTTLRIRINGIDCPERKQDYYKVSKDALGSYIFGKMVRLTIHGTDRFRRILADVYVGDENINLKMISNGFAWHYKKYSQDPEMALAEIDAQNKKLGLWEIANPVAPWNYRRDHQKKP